MKNNLECREDLYGVCGVKKIIGHVVIFRNSTRLNCWVLF